MPFFILSKERVEIISRLNINDVASIGLYDIHGKQIIKNISTLSNEIKFDENNTLGIIPNPNDGNFSIISSDVGVKNIEIMDAQGTILRTIKVTKKTTTVDIDGFVSGLYFLRCTFESNEIVTGKIIVY